MSLTSCFTNMQKIQLTGRYMCVEIIIWQNVMHADNCVTTKINKKKSSNFACIIYLQCLSFNLCIATTREES